MKRYLDRKLVNKKGVVDWWTLLKKQAMRNEARVLMKTTSQHHQDSFLVMVRDSAAMWG